MTAAHESERLFDGTPIGAYDRDEPLLERVAEERIPRVDVSIPRKVSVVLGRGSDVELEIHAAHCIDDGVSVQRRRGGGCAVVLDPGNVIVSVVLPIAGLGGISHAFADISSWLAVSLSRLGLCGVEQRGTSDLCVGDRKLGGSCIYRRKDLLYYSTTLLIDADLSRLDRYLPHPPREPEYRQHRTHGDFVIRTRDLGMAWTSTSLRESLAAELDPAAISGAADRSALDS